MLSFHITNLQFRDWDTKKENVLHAIFENFFNEIGVNFQPIKLILFYFRTSLWDLIQTNDFISTRLTMKTAND